MAEDAFSLASRMSCNSGRIIMEARPEKSMDATGAVSVGTFDVAGPLLITPRKFADERGFLSETHNGRVLAPLIGAVDFVQENHSLSEVAGTVRGLHFQIPPAEQGKLVRVVRGAAYDVAVDIRVGSPTFGRFVAAVLSAQNWSQLWIPAGFAHGFCTLEPKTEVIYKLTSHYSSAYERGLAWDDPALAIPWPAAETFLLSAKDKVQPALAQLDPYFRFTSGTSRP
jgi:dTDP-4-dehydrorhamnose 3,5-epimerase